MNQRSGKEKTLIGIGIGLVTLGLLLGLWLFLDYRAGKPVTPATSGLKIISLQNDGAIIDEYRDYAFAVKEDWLRDAGFDLRKRLYPQSDAGGVIRFKPPTEYFEVGLSSDSDKGITNINIVAASMRSSGVTEAMSNETLDELFQQGSREGSYDEVRDLPDGRVKADIAANGCIVTVSGYEKDKVKNLVSLLLKNCSEALK